MDRATPIALLLSLGLAGVLCAALHAQDGTTVRIAARIVDTAGHPLAEGTELSGRVEWHGEPPAGGIDAFEPVTVGADGALTMTTARWSFTKGGRWLHLARTGADGRRERILVPSAGELGTLILRPEERLASGTLLTEVGDPIPTWAVRLEVVGAARASQPPIDELLGSRFVHEGRRFELWGWRADRACVLHAFYLYHGPVSKDVPLVFGAEDAAITLPATGFLQVKLSCPQTFPERATFAVMRDLERRAEPQRHFLIPRDATNIRLLTGRYAVTCELNGVVVADFGTVEIGNGTTSEHPLDLRDAHVFVIEVVDPAGTPIPAARVRVVGSPDEPLSRQPVRIGDGSRHEIVVATTQDRVDLEVSEFGRETVRVDGVGEDRRVVLTPKKQ